MKALKRLFGVALVLALAGLLGGCAAEYYPASPHYMVQENPPPATGEGYLKVGPGDVTYLMRVEDRTPFGASHLPESMNTLYQKGYDQVRREREADFSIDVALAAYGRDNPEVRTGNVIGGALLGAAAGAIIGGAAGNAGTGAAIGAASGGALGMVSPAATPLVRIDITVRSIKEGVTSSRSATIDLATVPPPDVRPVIDHQVARMLQTLPSR
jgi:hypothetical protein